ncbi:hypothetical protein SAPIO_CDS6901 [Scedosporium apiospermum]|uniref:DUF676 domain-containing protein n=1 Tax=Pseudallescheria apiosperma TaxID=563466 RepID=A0A084G304_PSEDA|nr:uncharacterized protein SAPIO_CDS6901 [Scedosporium apiospermum]KEZ41716.1 hypothetical protein SAPIO_CDS6901 [Scedosporium apiospermum]
MEEFSTAKGGVDGLHVLYERPEGTQGIIDIVAVHGMGGHCVNSWTHQATKCFWLRDLLPVKMPQARIITFQYDTPRLFGQTAYGVPDHAGALLKALRDKRDEESTDPIVFIGHSLGGIIIKKAIELANTDDVFRDNIAKAAQGIVFFGTPHRGSAVASFLIVKMMTSLPGWSGTKFLPLLEINSNGLSEITEDFLPFAHKYALVTFYEQHNFPWLKYR